MPTDIKLKNSVTATNAPTSLQQGEVAINITDKKVWVGNAATTPVLLLGSGADGTFTNLTVSGVASFADGTVSLPSITNIGDTNTGIFFPAADTIAFTEGGVESMRIDASGNLGIGVTPSSWGSGRKALQIGLSSVFAGSPTEASFADLSANSFVSSSTGNFAYINTAAATLYRQINGTHQWSYAASGTAGNALTFTEAMRIDSAGKVLVGGTTSVYGGGSGRGALEVNGSSDSIFSLTIGGSTTNSAYIYNTAAQVEYYSQGTRPIVWNQNGTERMRIASSGNVGIGTNSPGERLTIVGAGVTYMSLKGETTTLLGVAGNSSCGFSTDAAVPITLGTNNTERMRIDSSGNLLVQTNSVYLRLKTGSVNFDISAQAGANDFLRISANGTQRFQFNDLGAAYNSTGTWGTISDARLKENIVDATSKLEKLNQLRVVNYNLKSDPDVKQIGFIAQEMEQVFPSLVDNLEEDGEGGYFKSVKTTVLIPILVKAIQELKATVDAQAARIAALESN
jgi:hypothetical protein